MTTTRVFTIEANSVGAGNSNEVSDSDNEDYVVEKVRVIDEEGNLGLDSDVTIQIGGNAVTDQVIPLADLDKDLADVPTMNINWPSNKQLRFSYTNDAGASITLKFVVYVREASDGETNQQPGEVLGTPLGMS